MKKVPMGNNGKKEQLSPTTFRIEFESQTGIYFYARLVEFEVAGILQNLDGKMADAWVETFQTAQQQGRFATEAAALEYAEYIRDEIRAARQSGLIQS